MEVALLFFAIIALLAIGVPIAIALGLSSISFLLLFSHTSLASVAQMLFQAMAGHYTLLAIPFFILASSFMATGGVASRIIRFSIACVGHLPGGLAIAGVLACMLFAALSGSSPATVVAIGSIVIAAMRQVGYSKDFAAGIICNAGTLGILIPPSIVMVVYATATDVSVGRMFLAGVIPGLLAGFMLMAGIYIKAKFSRLPKGDWLGWQEMAESILNASFGLFLIVVILAGIYGGVFTPTEAAAVASVYAFLVSVFIYRDLGPLKAKPWVDKKSLPRAQLGFRIVTLTLVAFLCHFSLANFIESYTQTLATLVVLVYVLSLVVFANLNFKNLHHLKETNQTQTLSFLPFGIIRQIFIALLGYIPAIFLIGMLYQNGSLHWQGALSQAISPDIAGVLGLVLALLFVIVLFGLITLPSVLSAYAIESATRKMIKAGIQVSLTESLRQGFGFLIKGLWQCLVAFVPSFIHPDTKKTLLDAAKITATLLFIIANALILKHVLTDEQIPQQIAQAMLEFGFGPIVFLLIVNFILLIGGQFMEPSGLIVIVAPLVFPIALSLGIDPIHLGIIMVVNMEIGMITPPVGLNLFVTSSVARMPLVKVVKAALPWLMILMVFLIMITYIPSISTVLPHSLMGPEIIVK